MEEPEKIVSQTELDDKAQKLVEDKDADSRLRVYIGPMEKTLTAVLLIWAISPAAWTVNSACRPRRPCARSSGRTSWKRSTARLARRRSRRLLART